MTTEQHTTTGATTAPATTDNRDKLDTAFDTMATKATKGKYDVKKNRATTEKITDAIRGLFEKLTGYESSPTLSITPKTPRMTFPLTMIWYVGRKFPRASRISLLLW